MNINVNPEELIGQGRKIIAESSTFLGEINKIYETISELSAVWTGEAATNYTNKVNSYKKDLEKFADQLQAVGNLLVATGTDYEAIEQNLKF